MRYIVPIVVALTLTACGPLAELDPRPSTPSTPSANGDPVVTAPPPSAAARTADALDTTTDEQRAAAADAGAAAGEELLGTTVASLGDPGAGGFWLATPLADTPGAGRVELGDAVARVELRPIDGPDSAGSRMSLPTFRLLGASLTDLPTITVYSLPETAAGGT